MHFLHKILCLLLLLAGSHSWARSDNAAVQRGEHNLRAWDSKQAFSLAGEWFFIPKEHISPQIFIERWRQDPQALMKARSWQRFQEISPDHYPDDFGIATYALVLHQVPQGFLALEGSSVYTSGRMQAFALHDPEGSLVELNIGEAGQDRASTRPLTASDRVLPLRVTRDDSWVILIHVSNFHHSWGGLWIAPRIGLYSQLSYALKAQDKLNYWLLGLIFFLIVYNIALYARRPEDRSSLFLANFSFIMFVRLVALAESASPLIPDSTLKFELSFKIIYATMIVGPMFLLYFLKSCFPDHIRTSWIKGFSAVFGIPVIVILFTPATVYGQLSNLMKMISLLLSGICLVVLVRAAWARDEGAIISLSGLVFVVVGAFLDILNSFGFDFLPINSTGIGMSAFIICQSQIVASRFARAFRRSEHLSRELQSEVEKQTLDIKSILTHIRQGIFTISQPDRKIDELHSEYLKELTRQSQMNGQNLRSLILDRSQLSEERKSLTEASLDASLGEDQLNFEINASNLVHELEFVPLGSDQHRMFELDWNPMLSKDQTVEKILVSIRDVTDLRALEAQARKQEEDMKVIMELIRIPEDRFHRFFDKTLDYLRENRELIQRGPQEKADVVKRLFVNMHTIKGASRTYYLGALSNVSHEVEQYYAALQKQEALWDQARLLHDLDRVAAAVQHYQHVGQTRLGWQSGNQTVRMPRKDMENALEMLRRLERMNLNDNAFACLQEAQRVLMETCYTALSGVIDEVCRGMDSMARDLGKATPIVELTPCFVVLKDKGADLLHSLLTHLLRNSLDHGFERPDERIRKGKAPQGRIQMEVTVQEPYFNLHYRDDGNGLDLIKLEQIGHERRLLPSQSSDQDTAELIFLSGLSTRDDVSEISGRGVGLDAVRSYLEEQGGFIQILLGRVDDRLHVPFTLIMTLPLSLCFVARTKDSRPLYVAG